VDWVTEADVADYLGTIDSDDPRLAIVAAASDAWCKRKRPDLATDAAPPADVALAAVMYAAYLFRLRSTPQGLAGDDINAINDASDLLYTVRRLLGIGKPIAR
jgi:hypothetical protein